MRRTIGSWLLAALTVAALCRMAGADERSLVFKLLAVNPSETESKEVALRGVLPPEIKADDVVEADGLDVTYDAQLGAVVVNGAATLKPKASLIRNVVIRDVWVIPADRFDRLSHEVDEILAKLAGTTFLDPSRCVPSHPVNILHIHGTADINVPYAGGALTTTGQAVQAAANMPAYPGAVRTIQTWAAYNGARDPVTDPTLSMDLDLDVPGLDTVITRYTNSPPGGAVELWTVNQIGRAHV